MHQNSRVHMGMQASVKKTEKLFPGGWTYLHTWEVAENEFCHLMTRLMFQSYDIHSNT